MEVLYIGIWKNERIKDVVKDGVVTKEREAVELVCEYAVGSYNRLTQGSMAEMISLIAAQVAKKPGPEDRVVVPDEKTGYICRARGRKEGFCGVVVSDKDYPEPAAFSILGKVCYEFASKYPRSAYANFTEEDVKEAKKANTTFLSYGKVINASLLPFPELKGYIAKYQDPEQADKIAKIEREVEETKVIMYKNIESVLERGQKIEDLVAKSDMLSAQSKMFYTQAKKQNSCCVVM